MWPMLWSPALEMPHHRQFTRIKFNFTSCFEKSDMWGSLDASMSRFKKPALLAIGATAAIPVVLYIADQEQETTEYNGQRRIPRKAKMELYKEDAKGFFHDMASRLYQLGSLSTKKEPIPGM